MDMVFLICAGVMLLCWIIYGVISILKSTGKNAKEMNERLDLLVAMVDIFVKAENQEYVNSCKDNSKDGSLTSEQATTAKNRVRTKIKECIENNDILSDVFDIFGIDTSDEDASIDCILDDLIEAAVLVNKSDMCGLDDTLDSLGAILGDDYDDNYDDDEDDD